MPVRRHYSAIGPNTSLKAVFIATSTSAIVAGMPRSTRLVTPCSAIPQGTMPVKWVRSGLHIQRHAVEGHPAAHAHADGSDLVFPAAIAHDPDADAALAPFALDVELRQRADQPFLEVVHIFAHVGLAALEVEHHIADALAGPVIGELPAAAGLEHGKARIEQVRRPARWCRRCRSADARPATRARAPRPWRWPRRALPSRPRPRDRAAARPHDPFGPGCDSTRSCGVLTPRKA